MAISPKKKEWVSANQKWTYKAGQKYGYTVFPNLLFWYAADLGINPPQQAVLFQLLSYWWFADNPPVVSKARLGEGLGITARQVQRHLRALEKAGLIEIRVPHRPGRHPNEYTFDGLIKKLEKISIAHGSRKRREEYERGKAVRSAKG